MSELISSKEVRNRLAGVWQRAYVLNTDQVFLLPTAKEVRKAIRKTKAVTIKIIDNISECDDLAIILWGKMKEDRAKQAAQNEIPSSEFYSWPLGICFGTTFNGWPANHWQNLCLTRDEGGVMMIEGQTEDFWFPSYPDDDVRFALI